MLRFTIERIRTLVLVAGVLLVVGLGVFLAIGRFRSPFSRRDIPGRLGIDIQQESNGVTYTQAHGGHTLFKIHASKVVQLKNDHAQLHDVEIELYGADGQRVDRIQGDEFEYNQKDGTATAAGPVEMTLTRPSAAAKQTANALPPGNALPPADGAPQPAAGKAPNNERAQGAQAANEIHVKTSGLTFDQKSGVATTAARVDFSTGQGSGSSMGAMYDSDQGFLVLDHAVELTTRRGRGGEPVAIHADHAIFERDTNLCNLRAAAADYRGGHATAGLAQLVFRDDGTAVRLEVTEGFTMATAGGSRVAAPTGSMDFDEHNEPRHGHLEGGVTMDSVSAARTVHGTSPTMELEFTPQGELRHAHLERGVEMRSQEVSQEAGRAEPSRTEVDGQAVAAQATRTWRSPVADLEFRRAMGRPGEGRQGGGRVEPATIHGFGGVVVTGISQRGSAAPARSKMAADEVDGEFGPGSALESMTGAGHASLDDTAATGSRQTATGDQLEAQFAPPGAKTDAKSGARGTNAGGTNAGTVNNGIQSAVLTGHVVLTQTPAPGARYTAPIEAWAGKAVYEDAGEQLHLTMSPRIKSGQSQLTADRIDIARESGQAFAHGNVKATYVDAGTQAAGAANAGGAPLGGHGPTHIIASEAEMNESTGSATFRGHARLWQQANSISGPVIVLDHQRQRVTAETASAADPVTAVLLSAGGALNVTAGNPAGANANASADGKQAAPAVIRVRGGDFAYSDSEHRAVMRAGVVGKVVAETGTATSTSNQVELLLMPGASRSGAGNNSAQANSAQAGPSQGAPAQVDRMTASGRVVLTSQGRIGTGEQLVYSGATGDYVLTGSAAAPPRMTDPQRGSATGEALIFHSRDDSVSIEGGTQETRTDTNAPK
jgi:lipopolysaccharide export system protein LptA